MLRNYFHSALRLVQKERLYVLINAFGLAVGLATCFIIGSWVRYEWSYDAHFPEVQRIFRITTRTDEADGEGMASTYPMVRSRLLPQLPEVEQCGRLFDNGFLGSKTRVAHGDRVLTNLRFYYGDSSVMSLFGFRVVAGDPVSALARPNTVVLTQSAAAKLLGGVDPIGKVIQVGGTREMEVTAVVEDLPGNTHFHFDLLASMTSHPWIREAENSVWSGVVFHTYVKLLPGADPANVEKKLGLALDDFPNDPNHFGRGILLQAQPLSSIHLHSAMKFELEPNGSARYVYVFLTIALLVLVVAMMNYVNLATARHFRRFKEVGVRKVLGAARNQLVVQFLVESSLVLSLAFAGALLLTEVVRPVLLAISGNEAFAESFLKPAFLAGAVGITLLAGIASAIFPALALSGIRPASLFRPSAAGVGEPGFRKALLVGQFVISLLLTFCTAITWKQMDFLHQVSLGYQKSDVIVLDVSLPGVRENVRALKGAFRALPGVVGTTASSQLPTDIQTGENIDVSPSQTLGVYCLSVDEDFFEVMGIPLAEGQDRLRAFQPDDSLNHFVLNQQALQAIGWTPEVALGQAIRIRHGNQEPGPVMAVAEDFHFQSLHHPVGPLVVEFDPNSYQYLLVRVNPDQLAAALEGMSKAWRTLSGGAPFDYQFLDEHYDRLYRSEQQSGTLFMIFAGIALIVSFLGLFGLASLTLERRTREIGLRKILGANEWSVATLISREFLVLMAAAIALMVPIGLVFRETWLSQFAYQAPAGIDVFLLSVLMNLGLAALALLYYLVKVRQMNPVDTLRSE